MNTPTHLLVAAALLARPGQRRLNSGVIAGALLPDLSLYLLVAGAAAQGHSFRTIFDDLYFSANWQTIFAIDNSIPLYAVLLGLGLFFKREWLWALAAAALLHIAFDLPLHHDDGRPHFWPISDWVFQSPVSYWDPEHFGLMVSPIEAVFALALCWTLWRRFESLWPRVTVGATAALQVIAIGALAFVFF